MVYQQMVVPAKLGKWIGPVLRQRQPRLPYLNQCQLRLLNLEISCRIFVQHPLKGADFILSVDLCKDGAFELGAGVGIIHFEQSPSSGGMPAASTGNRDALGVQCTP